MTERIGSRYPLSAARAREITRGFLSAMTPPATGETAETVALVAPDGGKTVRAVVPVGAVPAAGTARTGVDSGA